MRKLLFLLLLAFLAVPAWAACDLSLTVNCQGGTCTAVTTNNGSSACSGLLYSLWFSEEHPDNLHISAPSTSIGLEECVDSDVFGEFGVEMAFAFCYGQGSIGAKQSFTSTVQVSGGIDAPLMAMTWVGDEEGNETGSAYAFLNFNVATCQPTISAPPLSQSGIEYTVSWTAVSDPSAQYVVEESTSADFSANVTSTQVNGLSRTFRHDGMATTTTYYYRVRPTHCTGSEPQFSRTAQTVVQAIQPPVTQSGDIAVPFGSKSPVQFQVFVPGPSGKAAVTTTFVASVDKPYLTVTPSSGTLPPSGITLTVTADPSSLPPGASTGTVIIVTDVQGLTGGGGAAGTTLTIPISVSLVTPVAPATKTTPPNNALVIPVVTHVNGAAGPFLSDVRLTNGGSTPVQYGIMLTPTQTDGRQTSRITQITVDALQTIALNDIVKNFFGYGATSNPGDAGFGSLEIRPLNSSSTATYASSRTYASTLTGTFGQFIAAMPFTKFATRRLLTTPLPGNPSPQASALLSLQHISESAKFRTNLGIVEGAGEAASGKIRVFDALGALLKEIDYSLLPGEHRQMNRFIALNAGLSALENGRIEITVDSPTGAVTAYASVLDNVTTDPLAVMPVDPAKVSATRYVIPGMAELPNRADNFHSDLRLFNGGDDTPVTLTYYPQGGGAPVTAEPRTIRKGEVLVLDNVLPSLFHVENTGGSIVATTPQPSSLVATGRTYTSIDGGGSFGQFIPGVTPNEGVGLGERPLQVMQLEESAGFRSNVGLAELTGNPATARVSVHLPDSKVTASVDVPLAANEFRQIRPILSLVPNAQSYNARVTVEVVGGSGRVTAYGSVIDNKSKDPTYVPAQ
ncbi:MAG TPA: hypothetical protein VEK11_12735 [Thermoanaerobaculia bacterium]|nr:hypothetical protein [Thermoanaerobaculia bacterium]